MKRKHSNGWRNSLLIHDTLIFLLPPFYAASKLNKGWDWELARTLMKIYLLIPRITYKFLPNIFIIIHAWPSCLYCPIAVATIRIPGSIVDIKPMEFTWPWHATEEHCGSPEVGAEINSIFATKRDYMLPKIVVFGFAMDCKVQAST
jgi:hypothetical protein